MSDQLWSWVLTIVGVTGFILAGRKVWWCWYINIGCQVLWFTYAIVTQQYGFIVAALVYTVVFTQNAIKWTREYRIENHRLDLLIHTPTQERRSRASPFCGDCPDHEACWSGWPCSKVKTAASKTPGIVIDASPIVLEAGYSKYPKKHEDYLEE